MKTKVYEKDSRSQNENEKIKEISRLLDGDSESEITAVHAKELIAKFRSN